MKKKEIVINNLNDYLNFLKKLKYYKTFFYYNTCFINKNNTNIQDTNYIIEALNIKNRKKRINYIYTKSCKIIDDKFKDINICGFKNNKCYTQRKLKKKSCNGCCRKCLYQTNKGCSTKNLACKLFNCSEVKKRYDVVTYNNLKLLKVLSFKNQYIVRSDLFSKEEDVLKDLYTYTFTYAHIRIVYRLIRNYIYRKLKNKS